MNLKFSDLSKKKRTVAIWVIIFFLIIVNTVQVENDLNISKNTMDDTVSVNSLNYLNYNYSIGSDLSKNLEVYNNTIFQLNGYSLIEYAFSPSSGKIISDQTISMVVPQTTNAVDVKFTTNGNQSLILQNLEQQTASPYGFSFSVHSVIFELGALKSAKFPTEQSTLNVTCSIPGYYQTLNATVCYTRGIEFLGSSTLLVLQDYGNQYNISSTGGLNTYGASLVFYNMQSNKITKTVPLQHADSLDYNYIYKPKNSNEVLLYYTNLDYINTNSVSQGINILNLNNYKIETGFGNNIKDLYKGGYGTLSNQPLMINSKFLDIYYTSNSELTFVWYNIKPNTELLFDNSFFYFIILIIIVIVFREAWISKFKTTYSTHTKKKSKENLNRDKEFDKDLIDWFNEYHIQYREDGSLFYNNPDHMNPHGANPTPEMLPNCKNLNLFNLEPKLQLIPKSIDKLTGLTNLDLSKNQLRILPENFGYLVNLVEISLSSNQLHSFPSIGNLVKLQYLNLSHNNLTELPTSMESLISLKKLELNENQLASVEWLNGNMKNLEYIDLGNNKIEFLPESIGDLTNLRYLSISSNKLSSLPDSIGKLEKLEELKVSANFLITVPESIGKLKNLKTLYLGINRIKYIPDSIGDLTNLENLYISDNPITKLPNSVYWLKKTYNRLRIHGI